MVLQQLMFWTKASRAGGVILHANICEGQLWRYILYQLGLVDERPCEHQMHQIEK